jgi:hypothetical protein
MASPATHFHLLVGLCGLYMPDENHVYESRKEAEDGARELVKQFRDDGETVTGSARAGYYQVGESYCIEITGCDEADCLRDFE